MRYVSTRGSAQPLEFAEVLLEGLATDGGLYVPEAWPALPDLSGDADYVETATAVMWPFVEGSISHDDFASIVADAYSTFEPPQGSTPGPCSSAAVHVQRPIGNVSRTCSALR